MINRIKAKKPSLPTSSKNKFKPIVIIQEDSKTEGVGGGSPVITISSLPAAIRKIKTREKVVEVDEPNTPTYKTIEHSVVSEETVATTKYVDAKTANPNGIKIERTIGDVLKLQETKMAAQISKNVWVVTSDIFDDLEKLEKASFASQTKKTLFGKDLQAGKSLTVAELLAVRIKNIETSHKSLTTEAQSQHLVRYRMKQEYSVGTLIMKDAPKETVAVTSFIKVARQSSRYHLVQELGGDRRKRYIRVLSLFISSERALSRRIAQQERALIKAQSRSSSVRSKLKTIRRSRMAKR